MTSISSWDWFKFKGSVDDVSQVNSAILKFHDTQEADSWQQELRLSSEGGAPFPVPTATPGQNAVYAGSQDTEYLGIFGQATWNITDKFALTGGIRWQEEEKKASLEQGVTVPGLSLMSVNLVPGSVGGKQDRITDEVTWSVTPQYFITDDLTVYATAAHGFKSGGFNVSWGGTAMDQREFDDESIMHYEAGLKSTLGEA